jgi:hypothetical protein
MKKVLLTFALIFTAHVALAQDAAFKKDIMKVIEINGSAAQMNLVKNQILGMIPEDKHAAFLVEFDATMPALYDKLAAVYAEVYTKEDVKAMIAFYESPVGKKINAKAGEVAEKSQAASMEWAQGLQGMMMKYMQ